MIFRRFHGAIRAAGAAVLLAAAAACLEINEEYVDLEVTTTGYDGEPLAGTRVELLGGWYWEGPRSIATTDRDGKASFRVPPYFYRIDVYSPDPANQCPALQRDTVRLEQRQSEMSFSFVHPHRPGQCRITDPPPQ